MTPIWQYMASITLLQMLHAQHQAALAEEDSCDSLKPQVGLDGSYVCRAAPERTRHKYRSVM